MTTHVEDSNPVLHYMAAAQDAANAGDVELLHFIHSWLRRNSDDIDELEKFMHDAWIRCACILRSDDDVV